MRRFLACLTLLLLAASCGTDTPPQRIPPTAEAPQWQEAIEPITVANAANVALLGRLDQPESSTTLFDHAISPDATRLAALNNEEILAWNLLTGELIFRTARNTVNRIFYASDKTELYAVDPEALILVINAETGSVITTINGHNAYAGVIDYDPENDRMTLGGQDGTVKVWDMFERQSLVTFTAHSAPVSALAFSDDGTLVVTASGDGMARVWDWQNSQLIEEAEISVDLVQRIAFSPAGDQIALGTAHGARLWSLTDPALSRPLAIEQGGANHILTYSPTGDLLIGGTRSTGLTLWNPRTGARLLSLPDVQGSQISVDFSPDGTLMLTSALGRAVTLWDLTQANEQTVHRADLSIGAAQIYAAQWTDDSRLLLLFDATGPVYAWGISTTVNPV